MLPLAHHNLVLALPAFGPVVLVTLVLAIHAYRTRGAEDTESRSPD